MNHNTISDAMGYIDDRFLNIAENYVCEKPENTSATRRKLPALIVALVTIFVFTASVSAMGLFSPVNGDDFLISSSYNGDGIVTVTIENKSDNDLKLSPETKLMKFYANEEIPANGKVSFSNTLIEAHETESVALDLSEAYDITALEQPITDDWYYLLLTNNSFLFGYDWQCYVAFAETEPRITEYGEQSIALFVDEETKILAGLEKYFDSYETDVDARRSKIADYFNDCGELLSEVRATGTNIVSPENPFLFVGNPDESIIFDSRVPTELQYQLIGENHYSIDAYDIPVGENDMDSALVLSTFVGRTKYDISAPDGCPIPLIYIFQYAKEDIKSNDDCVFIRGRLLKISELEQYKVYEDDKYLCYEVTDLFYTDLDEYLSIMIESRGDVYFDEGMHTRVQNVYDYLKNKNNLEKLFYYNE